MEIRGFNKTTLLDYPGHLASTIFLGGCNFRCPFCHNGSLVLTPNALPSIPMDDIFSHLKKRKGILEGVCITGGEPTLYPGLKGFIEQIKELGLLVKLDTNGYNPHILQDLVESNLIDYVAMDVKNSPDKYSLSAGLAIMDFSRIQRSIDFLIQSKIDYEFRTTIVKEHHTKEDMIAIGQLIKGAKAYYLQQFKDSDDLISQGLTSHTKETLSEYRELLLPFIHLVEIRGVD